MKLKCVTSYGYPEPFFTVYYQNKELIKSRCQLNASLDVTESGEYSCKITKYMSSDQKQLLIPELSSLLTLPPALLESKVSQTTLDKIKLTTGQYTGRLETTLPGKNRQEYIAQLGG